MSFRFDEPLERVELSAVGAAEWTKYLSNWTPANNVRIITAALAVLAFGIGLAAGGNSTSSAGSTSGTTTARKGEADGDRPSLLRALSDFLKANNLKADWEGIENAPNEALVNALAMMSPYDVAEKQAMLEAPNLRTRAEILIAVTEIELAKSNTSGETPLQ